MLLEKYILPGGVNRHERHHILTMENFNFSEPAELFSVALSRGRRSPMAYRRFPTGAEAIKYVMETSQAGVLVDAVIENDEVRLGVMEIRELYQSAAYPLARPPPPGQTPS